MIHFFCPSCWNEIPEETVFCPICGYDLREYTQLDYEQKLICALKHPIKEIKRNVIFLIGLKRISEAIPELRKMIEREEDPILLMEIAKALRKINTQESMKILRELEAHKFPIIAKYVKESSLVDN